MAEDDKKLPTSPEIRVIFKGFVVSHIRPNTNEAWVGALDASVSTCHRPKILIYKITPPPREPHPPNDGQVELICPTVNLAEDFYLRISPNPQPGSIQTWEVEPEPFERLDEDNDKQDFRWFVDLDKIHPRPITFVEGKVSPKFHIYKGIFHTSLRSDGDARIGPAPTGSPTRRFGKFALEITARIQLGTTERATFKNGETPLIEDPIVKGGPRYDIVFDCSCPANDDGDHSDFDRIYDAITANPPLRPEDKRRFERHGVPRFNPEVYCMGGNGGG